MKDLKGMMNDDGPHEKTAIIFLFHSDFSKNILSQLHSEHQSSMSSDEIMICIAPFPAIKLDWNCNICQPFPFHYTFVTWARGLDE